MATPNYDFVCIQGIPVPAGQSPGLRTEVSAWAGALPETSIQVSLFIRALQRFYDVPYEEKLSFFQVAGMQ
jgi:tyrosinase